MMTDLWEQRTAGVLQAWGDAFSARPEGLLYHYTDFDGFQGIVKEHTLRATYSKVLNDGSERIYGEKVMSDTLKREVASERQTSSSIDSNVKELSRPTFVTSFCDCGKLLSMWRAYAGHGGGYCLGFTYTGLANLRLKDALRSEVVLGPMQLSYGEQLSDPIKCLLRDLASLLKTHFDNASPLLEFVPMLGPMVKDEAFAEEREWRLIVIDPRIRRMHFRAGHANIRPYVELSLREKDGATEKLLPLPLEKVICGPTLRQEDRPDEVVRWMLEKSGYKDVGVEVCSIPYRL